MGLLTTEVYLSVGSYNINYYSALGYDISRPTRIRYDNNGWKRGLIKNRAEKGTKFKVNVSDLPNGSCVNVDIQCDDCNTIFTTQWREYLKHKTLSNEIFCVKCRAKRRKMNNKEIVDKNNIHKSNKKNFEQHDSSTRDPELNRKFVIEVLYRDNFTCQMCKRTIKESKLVVHHLNGYNWSVKQRYDSSNGICLCEDCHKEFHKYYGYGYNVVVQYKHWLKMKNNNYNLAHHVSYNYKIAKRNKKTKILERPIYCIEDKNIITQNNQIKRENEKYTEIAKCCDNKKYSYLGKHYLWYDIFINMKEDEVSDYVRKCEQKSKGLNVICLNFGMIFDNSIKAYKCFKLGNGGEIIRCCKGLSNKGGTLVDGTELRWCFYDDYVLNYNNDISKLYKPKEDNFYISKKNYKEPVLCKNDKIIFDSYRLAGKYYGISKATVKSCCLNGKETRGSTKNKGLKFSLYDSTKGINNEYKHITLSNIDMFIKERNENYG